jgi:predicted TIM-barrel fold metal-dependent hydrolase
MAFPTDCPVVDTMIGLPIPIDEHNFYDSFKPLLRDAESKDEFEFPAQYMFKNVPHPVHSDDYAAVLIAEMDRFNIEQGVIGANFAREEVIDALKRYPDRLFGFYNVDPNSGMDGVRELVRAREELGVVAASAFPAGCVPQVPINDKKFYPFYAKCVELDIPIFLTVGVPGPRLPLAPQKVELLDEVCWFFPELTVITRHGCMPDVDLAVQLLLKWPNLYYSTSAMAPKHYPPAILRYMNTRGADKVMFAGYFPMGLSLDRTFGDMALLDLKDEVWPKFLHGNARRVLRLPGADA